ncbi:conserved Plasmodium protein, unknown function [Plasmodium sp. DRC-Itaito]|nr:conserved Plasmodium protein, unknown function [Plasmodium sp. DRC-Itaito]
MNIHKSESVESTTQNMNPIERKILTLNNINDEKDQNEIIINDRYIFEKREDEMYNMTLSNIYKPFNHIEKICSQKNYQCIGIQPSIKDIKNISHIDNKNYITNNNNDHSLEYKNNLFNNKNDYINTFLCNKNLCAKKNIQYIRKKQNRQHPVYPFSDTNMIKMEDINSSNDLYEQINILNNNISSINSTFNNLKEKLYIYKNNDEIELFINNNLNNAHTKKYSNFYNNTKCFQKNNKKNKQKKNKKQINNIITYQNFYIPPSNKLYNIQNWDIQKKKKKNKNEQIKHQQIKHQQIKHQQIKHQQIKHQQIKHQQIKHQQIKHLQIKHPQIKHQQIKHQQIKHQQIKHQQIKHQQIKHLQIKHPQIKHQQINIINNQIHFINNHMNKNIIKNKKFSNISDISPKSINTYMEYEKEEEKHEHKDNNIFSSYITHAYNKKNSLKKLKIIKRSTSKKINKDQSGRIYIKKKKNTKKNRNNINIRYFNTIHFLNYYYNIDHTNKEQIYDLHSNHDMDINKKSHHSYNLNIKNIKNTKKKNITNQNDQTFIYQDHTFEERVEDNKMICLNKKLMTSKILKSKNHILNDKLTKECEKYFDHSKKSNNKVEENNKFTYKIDHNICSNNNSNNIQYETEVTKINNKYKDALKKWRYDIAHKNKGTKRKPNRCNKQEKYNGNIKKHIKKKHKKQNKKIKAYKCGNIYNYMENKVNNNKGNKKERKIKNKIKSQIKGETLNNKMTKHKKKNNNNINNDTNDHTDKPNNNSDIYKKGSHKNDHNNNNINEPMCHIHSDSAYNNACHEINKDHCKPLVYVFKNKKKRTRRKKKKLFNYQESITNPP